MSREITGGRSASTAIMEYGRHLLFSVASTDFVWFANNRNNWFKIVTEDDCKLNVLLKDEKDLGSAAANAAVRGYLPFKAGEGSNAKVIKVYKDASNTISGLLWAVR
jgi:hypothetical protein